MKKVLVLLVVILATVATTVEAQRKGKPKLSKECKTELQTYYQANVYPVKKAAHDKLMASLTEEDVTFVNEKRAEKQAIKVEVKAARKEVKSTRKNGATKEEMKQKMEATKEVLKSKKNALKASMKPFIERNSAIIDEVMAPFKETRKKWRAEKRAIIDKHLTDEQKAKRDARKEEAKGKKGKDKSKKAAKGHGKIRFVLWNSTKKEDIELEEEMFFQD